MSRLMAEKKIGAGRVVAVAIENNKTSQYAAKWAVDTVLPKDHHLLLIHVKQRASSIPTPSGNHVPVDVNEDVARAYKQQMDNESRELFASFRVFCNRKNIQCKEILLEDMDITKALIESISTYSIELLVLGAASRSGLVRRFRTTDVPCTVSKGAPPFCTVYIIAKGKISSVRSATAPLNTKAASRNNTLQLLSQPQHSRSPDRMDTQVMRNHPPRSSTEKASHFARQPQDDEEMKSVFTRTDKAMNREFSISESDISFVSSGRPSVDRLFPSLYDDLDSGIVPRISLGSDLDFRSFSSSPKSIDHGNYSYSSQDSGTTMVSPSRLSNSDEVEAEMRRLKLELKQTMEMYSSACKEALTAKQKAVELQRWKVEEERKFEEARLAEEAAMALAEKEKAKCKAAMEAAEASRKLVVLEAQRRKKSEMKSLTESEQKKKAKDTLSNIHVRYRRYTIEEIEETTKQFSKSLKIGEGGYGPVYRGELDHTQVAIKVLKADAAQGRSQFQQEVEVLSCIRHPNMVLLLGACPEYGCLVYEYMANGSLDDCLFQRGNSPVLPWQLRFRIAAEIATGLLFLHQTKPEPLVHRDLKPGNILLDRNFVAKISDVGLARLVPPSLADTVTQYRLTATAGTFCYIDPEYQQTGMLGIKSDVYSMGIMLLQIITAKPPMGLTHHVARAIENGTFGEMLDPDVEDWPIEHALHFAKIALKCAEMRRKDRPNLGKVVLPELNKLRAFAEENMAMMMKFGCSIGFTPTSHNYHLRSSFSNAQVARCESLALSEMSGYESHSSTSSSVWRP